MWWSKGIRTLLPVSRRAFEAERAARHAAEAAGARLALFADATKALTSSFDLNVVLHDLARLVAPAFADACMIDLVEPDGSIRRAATAIAPAHEAWAAALEALRPPAKLHENTAREALSSRLPQVIEEADYSAVVVPLKGRPGTLGVLWLVQANPGAGPATVDLAEELARRASIAVENARLFARQRTVSETLQQSLLPERLPEIPGLTTAARYVPGGPDVDIGGDWYDVIQLPGAGIGLALGDVVGRGERAAHSWASSGMPCGPTPSRAGPRADHRPRQRPAPRRQLRLHGDDDLRRPRRRDGRLLLRERRSPAAARSSPRERSQLPRQRERPSRGSLPTARYTESTARLAPGATLLLYTDGLVEDRATSLDEGLQRLCEAAVEGPADLEAFCSHVMRRVVGPCRATTTWRCWRCSWCRSRIGLLLRVPAQPGALAPLRATLRRWLLRAGASELEAYEVLTACGEACTNAIRHASGPLRSEFEVEAAIVDDGVEICVRDQGTWRERRSDVGGRGLPIIEAYVDEFEITPSPSGTEVRMRRRLSADGELVR